MKKIAIFAVSVCAGLGALLGWFALSFAQIKGAPVPFSADWASYESDERQESGKYYASGQGIRLEGTAAGESFVVIYDFDRKIAWNLLESERMYIETSIDSAELGVGEIGQFGAPCPPAARANRIGSETWQGRKTEKWTCAAAGEPTITIWYDPKLQTSIRIEDADSRMELTNIKEGRQPANLFVPPPGYTKMEIPSFGMPPGASQGDQQLDALQEMMRGLMQ